MTDAERLLWARLRGDQQVIRFRRQHPIGRHVVDFFAPEVKLAVELDGSQHARADLASLNLRLSLPETTA